VNGRGKKDVFTRRKKMGNAIGLAGVEEIRGMNKL